MRLRNGAAGEAASPVVVVALRAREVELALAAVERRLAPPGALVPFDGDRHAARLACHVGGEREQLPALVGERRGLFPLGAAGGGLVFPGLPHFRNGLWVAPGPPPLVRLARRAFGGGRA